MTTLPSGQRRYRFQILLPITDNRGHPYAPEIISRIQQRLVEKFGGYTAHSRAPAQGVWVNEGEASRDEIVVVEVLAEDLDREWWQAFRSGLERDLGQEQLVITAQEVELI